MTKSILTFQSHVAMGHVGLEAARLPLYLAGFDVWTVPTVLFSNHPGYGRYKGHPTDFKQVADLIDGLETIAPWENCQGILTGYMGSAENAALIFQRIRSIRDHRPHLRLCMDPVMGDKDTGYYVKPDIPQIIKDHVPSMDVITPNHFELDSLVGYQTHSLNDIIAACHTLLNLGPSLILVTSVETSNWGPDKIGLLAITKTASYQCVTDKIPLSFPASGAGDVTAALFIGQILKDIETPHALSHTANAIFGLMKQTHERAHRELDLIGALDCLRTPTEIYPVTQIF